MLQTAMETFVVGRMRIRPLPARVDFPVPPGENVGRQRQRLADVVARQRAHEVLLVREHEHRRARELLLVQQLVQLVLALLQPPPVRAVDHPHEPVGLLEVVAPVRADGRLAADVPHVERVAAVLERLDVEAERRRDRRDVLAVELFQDGGPVIIISVETQPRARTQ